MHVQEQGKIYTVNGFTGNVPQIAKHFGIKYATLNYRLKHGMSIDDAVNKPTKYK